MPGMMKNPTRVSEVNSVIPAKAGIQVHFLG
jgi:hypothetical protein